MAQEFSSSTRCARISGSSSMKFLSTWLRNGFGFGITAARVMSSMKFLSTWLRNLDHTVVQGHRIRQSSMKFLSTWLRNAEQGQTVEEAAHVLNEVPEHMAQESLLVGVDCPRKRSSMKFLSTLLRNSPIKGPRGRVSESSMKFLSTWLRNLTCTRHAISKVSIPQ